MQAEVLRIIEGGLTGDKTKVLNYARTLADNLEQSGDVRFAKAIPLRTCHSSPIVSIVTRTRRPYHLPASRLAAPRSEKSTSSPDSP